MRMRFRGEIVSDMTRTLIERLSRENEKKE